MPPFSARLVLAGFLLILAGCGGKSQVDESQLGSHAGSSNNPGGAGGAGNLGGAGNPGGAGSQAGGAAAGGAAVGGGPAMCLSFVDAKPSSLPVLIRNDLKVAIHFGSRLETCGESPLFLVRDASGTALTVPGPCRTACETLLEGNAIGGCPAICRAPEVVTLAPGESVMLDWAGLADIAGDLPRECIPKRPDGLDFGTRCNHAERFSSGMFTFSAEAGTALDCSTSVPGCSKCEPNEHGGCTTYYALVGGSVLTARLAVELDAAGGNEGVDLIFEE